MYESKFLIAFNFFLRKIFCRKENLTSFAPRLKKGAIAQSVEQRTENPCVPGSIPGGTTRKNEKPSFTGLFYFTTTISSILF
jgi:hypothetical protein